MAILRAVAGSASALPVRAANRWYQATSAASVRPTTVATRRIRAAKRLLLLRVCEESTLPPLILQPGDRVNHDVDMAPTTRYTQVNLNKY